MHQSRFARPLITMSIAFIAIFVLTIIERHEALLNLVVVKYHRHRPVAAGCMKLRVA